MWNKANEYNGDQEWFEKQSNKKVLIDRNGNEHTEDWWPPDFCTAPPGAVMSCLSFYNTQVFTEDSL